MSMASTGKLTAKAIKALRDISRLTGVKMYVANEQAIVEKLARIKADKAKPEVSA